MQRSQTKMRDNQYTIDGRIRFSEVDHTRRITLPGIVNYFQDCSTFQSEDLGLGIEHCSEKKRAWILSSWQVVVERYPKIGEKIQTSTWATDFNGLFGERNFCMTDSEGKDVAYANSLWVYMDMEKGRPSRPEESEIAPYGVGDSYEMEYESRKSHFRKRQKNWKVFRYADIILIRMSMSTTANMYRWRWNHCQKIKKCTRCVWNIRNQRYMVM